MAVLNNSIGPIARNCMKWPLATIFVGRSCPPKSYFENPGNKRLPATNSCSLHILCTLDFEGHSARWLSLSVESTFVYDLYDLIYTVFSLIIWSVKYWTLLWIINDIMQMVINRYSTRHRYHGSCKNGHSVRLKNRYCVSNTRLWLNTGPWSGLLML